MAYIIYNPDAPKTAMSRIAADDTEKAKYVGMLSEEITTEEFNNLKNNTKYITGHDGTNYTYADNVATGTLDDGSANQMYNTKEDLDIYISDLIKNIESWVSTAEGHPQSEIDDWNTYKNSLSSFDTSTVTFPLNTPWEKYCEDNSISYKSLLQLP